MTREEFNRICNAIESALESKFERKQGQNNNIKQLMTAYAEDIIKGSPADVLYYGTHYKDLSREDVAKLNLNLLRDIEIKKDGVKISLQNRFEAYSTLFDKDENSDGGTIEELRATRSDLFRALYQAELGLQSEQEEDEDQEEREVMADIARRQAEREELGYFE